MGARGVSDLAAFEYLLDEIDPAARPVELVAQQLIGRACRGTESAVHTGAQNAVGLDTFWCVTDEIGEMGFQGGSKMRVHARGIEDPRWIEALFERSMDVVERLGKWCEHASLKSLLI
jgi:hypothetical protein